MKKIGLDHESGQVVGGAGPALRVLVRLLLQIGRNDDQSRKIISSCLILCLLVLSPRVGLADDMMVQADAVYNIYDLPNIKKSIDLYKKILEKNPNNYEASWKCAMAHRNYGDESKFRMVEGWEDICATYGKGGMTYALKAIDLEPNKTEGHYYYSLSVAVYADGVSIFTAVRENLKNKTQKGFEKAYSIDKTYDEAGPILALGCFWASLPWPLKNKKKGLEYLREYQKTEYFADGQKNNGAKGRIYLADLLIDIGGKENEAEAKTLAQQILKSDKKFFREWAKRLLAEL